ncbi:transposase [Prevotella nigrescens]|uniref:transposase n=1 Tax=Prevotella nigrescens TaxID=28133 RepID=UPI003621FD0E
MEAGRCQVSSITPTRGAVCWKEDLEALKERGSVAQIDLVVSDALQGTGNAVCAAFPPGLPSVVSSDRY